jgi:formylglycine-generating enzyme required for sulfatase activity
VDKYEASVWQIPAADTKLVTNVQKGTATLADLIGGGATQVSPSSSCMPAFPMTFPNNGNWTQPLYAVSIPGVHPTACVTWFQAVQACALSGKRLLSNEEWQRAAAGTPDPGPVGNGVTTCATEVADVVNTGSTGNCVSNWGASDMVGNVDEWVADWVPRSTNCPDWGLFSDDFMCLAGASTTFGPGALYRGGGWNVGSSAGVFAIAGESQPEASSDDIGFRCGR